MGPEKSAIAGLEVLLAGGAGGLGSATAELLEAESGKKIAGWVRERLWDFHKIDKMATLFRYADPPADGELWIDFHQLQVVIDKLVQAIEDLGPATVLYDRLWTEVKTSR